MAESLATKYRPHEFKDVCSQESIIRILEKQIETRDFKNVFLFCGSSGCGKTTIARIFANKINNGVGEPIEIDAASTNGVDNIKMITKLAQERAIDGEYKIYIIDECHSLTSQAWQAFLKCIEEPPKYTIFIFCTTDPQKIPDTILNRVMRFNFNRIKTTVIRDRLKYICDCEGFTDYIDTIDYISRISDGGMRTAISLLDKVSAYNTSLTLDNALSALGNYSYTEFFKLLNAILDSDEKSVLQIISDYYDAGNDLKVFVSQFLSFCIDVDKYAIFKSCEMTHIPSSMIGDLEKAIKIENVLKVYTYLLDNLLMLKNMVKNDVSPRGSIEVIFLKMARFE